jgi:heme exporter protein B
MFSLILKQTLIHAYRKGGGAFGTCAFYIIIITVFAFGLGPEGIKNYAGAVMCVGLLLATVTALPLMYERDHEDGSLEQFLLQPVALEVVVLAKIMGQWLSVIGPILIISPAMAVFSDLDYGQTLQVLLKLLLASPTLVAIGSIAAALTIGAKRGGLLQALVVIPFYIPVLIFAAASGEESILFLSGMLFASLPIACWVGAALIRVSQD